MEETETDSNKLQWQLKLLAARHRKDLAPIEAKFRAEVLQRMEDEKAVLLEAAGIGLQKVMPVNIHTLERGGA